MTQESPLLIQDIDAEFTGSVTMLAYGEGGTGKTEFLGSIGDDGIILSCGEGELTLQSPGYRSRYSKIPKIVHLHERVDSKTGMFIKAEAWDKFTDFCDWFVLQDKFNTLAVDDATNLSMFARNRGMEANAELSIGSTLLKSNTQGFPVPEVADYGKEINILVWFLLNHLPKFKERKKNFILAAHERHIYAKGQNIGDPPILTKILPGFTGKVLPDQIQGYFDFVWRFECANGTVFRAKTISNNNYQAKTRWSGVFPEEVKNPNFSKLLKILESRKTFSKVGNFDMSTITI